MKTRGSKMEEGGRLARSVLECDRPLPLLQGDEHPVAAQSARGLAQSKTGRSFVASLVFLATAIIAQAQTYSIDWFTIDGGGGGSTGGVYSVTGTIGQPDAGEPMTGGPFTLTGGFWALPVAVQTTNAPALLIVPATPGFATLSWAPPTPDFVLQVSDSLAPPAWTNAPSGSTNPVTVPATLPTRFYRLIEP